jgi:hypothetical protein
MPFSSPRTIIRRIEMQFAWRFAGGLSATFLGKTRSYIEKEYESVVCLRARFDVRRKYAGVGIEVEVIRATSAFGWMLISGHPRTDTLAPIA